MKTTKSFNFLSFAVLLVLANASSLNGQSCSGNWVLNVPLTFDCISGQHIGRTTPSIDPPGCPLNPNYTPGQTNTFNFNQPVGGFIVDFNALSTSPGCGRIEIKINGLFYFLQATNVVNLSTPGCTGSFSYISVTADGYITTSSQSMMNSNAQGRIIISDVIATSITISTNDAAGSVFTNPYNCISVVPVRLKSFSAKSLSPCKAGIAWETGEELNLRNIEIQKSLDGLTFRKADSVFPKGSNSRYTFVIDNLTDCYYRLQINDLDGTNQYSQIVKVNATCNKTAYQIIPNPARIFLKVANLDKNDKVMIFNAQGNLMMIYNPPQNNSFDIQKLPPGIYILRIINERIIKSNLKVIKA